MSLRCPSLHHSAKVTQVDVEVVANRLQLIKIWPARDLKSKTSRTRVTCVNRSAIEVVKTDELELKLIDKD